MSNDKNKISNNKKIFDLEERTSRFSEGVLCFCRSIAETTITRPLISQLIRSATSVGANYCEADCAGTKKDFIHRLTICKREAKETKYWLRLIVKIRPDLKGEGRKYWQEANELNLIFSKIIINSKKKV